MKSEIFEIRPAVAKRIESGRLDVNVAGSDPPTAGESYHLAALCWPWSLS